ncbi:MAG TPA: ABC transporter permease [Bacteroidota bacterium]|nr:ABC transporter permease [Bacteroidota bacterium]
MKYLDVARWEFIEKVKSKAFIISLVLMPVIMIVFGVLPGLLASKPDEKTITVGIIDETGQILKPLAAKLDQKYKLPDGRPNYIVRDLKEDRAPEDVKAHATRLISDKLIEGYFTIPSSVYDSGKVEYRAENVGNIRISERFSRTIEEVIVEHRLTGRGLDPAEIKKLMANIDVRALKVSERGGEKESGFMETFASAYIVIMMLMFLVMTSGQLLIRSVVEEKSNRVIEVLLSSCSARDLMIGKILGLSGLGILQMMVWGVIGLGLAMKSGANVFEMESVLISVLYVILGYFFYSAIFVAAGSPVTTEQEAQQITSYVSLILVFPIVLMVPAMQNPDSSLIKILSFIPLLTPAFMVLRVSIQMPPLWEILTTLGLLLASAVFMMWAAGKIFRIAILVYGKRPSIGELIRWVRTP